MGNNDTPQSISNMELCPMASMCKGMAKTPGSRILLMIPGFVLVLVGVLIFLEPKVLVWLMAGAAILIGVTLLFFANFLRKL